MSGETTPRAKAQMVMPVLPDLDMLNLGDKNNKQEAEAQGNDNVPIVKLLESEDIGVPKTPIKKSASAVALGAPMSEDDVFGYDTTPTASRPGSRNSNITVIGPPGKEVISKIEQDLGLRNKAIEGHLHQPRADRGVEPTAANAQGLFSPDGLVFVANLSNDISEEQLELSCQRVFDVFGSVHVKVKRDKNKHLFALLQFENVEDAIEAIKHGNGTIIEGRQVRLERAKAERAVVITRLDSVPVTEAEACEMLNRYGAQETVFGTERLSARPTSLPQGQFVRFAYYLDCRDALRSFNIHSPEYRLQLASGYEQQIKLDLATAPRKVQHYSVTRSETDIKSVFVGNLPTYTTKEDVLGMFSEHGTIVDLNVISKTYPGNTINTFAFVEYTTHAEAINAASVEKVVGKQKLRIEPKEYTSRRPQRLATAAPLPAPAQAPITPPSRNTPRRLAPAAAGALQARLLENQFHNTGTIVATPPAPVYNSAAPMYSPAYSDSNFGTPSRLIPSDLFSPSPQAPVQPAFGYNQGGTTFYQTQGYGTNSNAQAAYSQDEIVQPAFNQGEYNQGGFPQGGFNQSGFPQGGFNQGGFGQGGFGQGGYGQGGGFN